MSEPIPVIDIFAGPGGLGEGFTSVYDESNKRVFKIALSIEKDEFAHQTLELRSFFRQFDKDKVPDDYYRFLRGEISREELFNAHPNESAAAKKEAWKATLGETSEDEIDSRIKEGLKGKKNWVLIGGPPCQAYSIVGRARHQLKENLNEKDPRVFLYREYYRILAVHNPPVFVMENVKGLLSSKLKDEHIFNQILHDLSVPGDAYQELRGKNKRISCPGYKIYSLVKSPDLDLEGNIYFDPRDFIVRAEEYGIPQRRHRIILLGIRNDLIFKGIDILQKHPNQITIKEVIDDLPRLRSGLSKEIDSAEAWEESLRKISKEFLLTDFDNKVKTEIRDVLSSLKMPRNKRGADFIRGTVKPKYKYDWFIDERIEGICNHSTRAHIKRDLYRYLYSACYAKVYGRAPKLLEFPKSLLPKHENKYEDKFNDRFRVQTENSPATTITSHISKDGHYYIHYDPSQCRSLTVREAARIQTFPDNYFFCGPRTSQYTQVGNAVPPLLANQIANFLNMLSNSFP